MSVTRNNPFLAGLSDHLTQVALKPENYWYAFRVGFIGSDFNRFHPELLGKVVAERSFEPNEQSDLGLKRSTTNIARELLAMKLGSTHPVERQRLIVANLYGSESESRLQRLNQAVAWLKAKDITVIYFQYQWMVEHAMKQQLNLFECRTETLAVP